MIIFDIVQLITSVTLSFFFSMSETAMFSLTQVKIDGLQKNHPKRGNIISGLLSTPQKLLVSILTCNIFVNIYSTILASRIFLEIFPSYRANSGSHLWAVIITMTLVILIFGEVTPKSLAIKFAPSIALFVAPIFFVLIRVLFIFILVFRSISKFLVKIVGFTFYRGITENHEYKSGEMIEVIKEGGKSGAIDHQEKMILENAVNFTSVEIGKICRPRCDAFLLPHDIDINDAINLIREYRYSRIPIYRGDTENIIGILYIKDLLNAGLQTGKLFQLRRIFRKPIFVPGSLKAEKLLKLFQATHNHIAIVIDEFGGVMGLITMEDIIEQIVGDVVDKIDIKPLYQVISQDIIELESKLSIGDFNYIFDSNLFSNHCATIGGFVCEQMQMIPQTGTILKTDGLQFRIDSALPNKIERMTVTRLKSYAKLNRKRRGQSIKPKSGMISLLSGKRGNT